MLLFLEGEGLAAGFCIYILPFLIVIQAALLLVPVAQSQDRPVKRRRIIVATIVGAIPMAVMTVMFFYSILLMFFGEERVLLDEEWFLASLAVLWLAWGVIFYRSFSKGDASSFVSGITRWLLRGSILEVVVAIPSHIISRQRGECCAPAITLLGITTGLSLALLSFGPGVFFLFVKRIRDKRGKAQSP